MNGVPRAESTPSAAHWATAALLLCCTALLSARLLNHDVALHMHAGAAMFRGLVLYRDFVEMNPPLAYVLAAIPQLLADSLKLEPYPLLVFFVMVLALLSTRLCLSVAERQATCVSLWTRSWSGFFLLLALLLPSIPHFGQREHLLAISVFPYLLASVPMQRPALPRRLLMAIGVLAGLGMALKPHFVALLIAVEWNRCACGERFSARRLHLLTAVAVLAVYWALVALFAREYFTEIVPLALRDYGAWSPTSLLDLIDRGAAWSLVALVLGVVGVAPRRSDGLRSTLSMSIAALLLITALQRKGHDYHSLPAMITAMLLLALLSEGLRWQVRMDCGSSPLVKWGARPTLVITLCLLWLLAGTAQAIRDGLTPRRHEGTVLRLAELVHRHGRGRPILVLSIHVFPAFPLVNLTRSRWAMRFSALWPLVGRIDRAEDTLKHRGPLADLPGAVADDMQRYRPRVVVVDENTWGRRTWPIITYLSRSERFVRLWRRYRELTIIDGYRVYLGCPQRDQEALSAAAARATIPATTNQ